MMSRSGEESPKRIPQRISSDKSSKTSKDDKPFDWDGMSRAVTGKGLKDIKSSVDSESDSSSEKVSSVKATKISPKPIVAKKLVKPIAKKKLSDSEDDDVKRLSQEDIDEEDIDEDYDSNQEENIKLQGKSSNSGQRASSQKIEVKSKQVPSKISKAPYKDSIDDRSGKKYKSKELDIPDEVESQLFRVFELDGFKDLLYRMAEASVEEGLVVTYSNNKKFENIVARNTDILIEIPYEYIDNKYSTSDPYLYYYDTKSNRLTGKEITLNSDGELQAKIRTIDIKDKKGREHQKKVGDQLGTRYKISEYLDGGIIIKPFNRTSGIVIIKLSPDTAIRVCSSKPRNFKALSDKELEEFFHSNCEQIKKNFNKLVDDALKERPVKSKIEPSKLMNAYLYLLPMSIDQESGDKRYLVPEFLWLMNKFIDTYEEINQFKAAVSEYMASKPKKDKKEKSSAKDLLKALDNPEVLAFLKKKLKE